MGTQRPTLSTLVSAACLLGLVVTWAVVFPRLRPSAPALAGTNEPLVSELADLRRTHERTADILLRLENLLADRLVPPATTPTARRPLDEIPTPESFDQLAGSLDALRVTFERESIRTQELLRAAPVLGGESLVEVRERRRATDWAALEDLEQLWRDDQRAADRSQYFQTARGLLEAYGPPTAIYRPEGGMLFHYRRTPEGVPGPSWYFRLQDGIVIEFFVEDETAEDE